jgi:cell division protein FtsB
VAVELLRRPRTWVVALLLAALLGGTIASDDGVFTLLRLRRERDALWAEIFAAMRTNERLRSRLRQLQESDRLLERVVRQRLGLVREGEIVYRFPPPPAEETSLENETE